MTPPVDSEIAATPAPSASSQELAGDLSPLARALGPTDALASLSTLAEWLKLPRPANAAAITVFLERYRTRILEEVELPAIVRAYQQVAQGHVRELLQLDARLGGQFDSPAFAKASRQVGRLQLRRLRPLRDRTLQKYLQAVEVGEASGWHVVVFGILLALFSLPIRQGLLHYLDTTQERLVDSAVAALGLPAAERKRLLDHARGSAAESLRRVLPGPEFDLRLHPRTSGLPREAACHETPPVS